MWKLGLDLGTDSIGWCVFTADGPEEPDWDGWALADAGVRISSDGREPSRNGRAGESRAVARRLARGIRRNRDHGKNRIQSLVRALIDRGLLPADEGERAGQIAENPHFLRAQAVQQGYALTAGQLGRVLLHLGLRRGFLSNRKSDREEKEDSAFMQRISTLHRMLCHRVLTPADLPDPALSAESPSAASALPAERPWTLGEFLHERDKAGLRIRFRGKDGDLFPDRRMYRTEFDLIRQVQAPFHPALTSEDWEVLRDSHILFQHPLRPVERGFCSFYPEHHRTFRDTPVAQRFRIARELGDLFCLHADQSRHRLSAAQYHAATAALDEKKELTFHALRKLKGKDKQPLFPPDCRFSLEDGHRKGLQGNSIAAMIRSSDNSAILLPLWQTLPPPVLDDIFERLHTPVMPAPMAQAATGGSRMMDDAELAASLVQDFALRQDEAKALVSLPLGAVTSSYSRQAMTDLLSVMAPPPESGRPGTGEYEATVTLLGEAEAKRRLASFQESEQRYDQLPYYGEILKGSLLGADPRKPADSDPEGHYGKIGNPTVHIALNQLRKLVNELVNRFGEPPSCVQVELARDLKLPKIQRDAIQARMSANEKANRTRADWWKGMTGGAGPTARDLRKIRLWEELAKDEVSRCCVFTGRVIEATHLVNGEVEIEHLLPRSRTLDDSMSNLTLSFRDANRLKGNQTPWEAFADDRHAADGIVWAEVLGRAGRLPVAKARRFAATAMEDYEGETDFIARQMTDNAWIARVARRYLTAICPRVFPAPGRLTAMIRGQWQLNSLLPDDNHKNHDNRKNRNDHRHHTVDAFVIGLASRSMLQRVSTARSHDREVVRLPELPEALRQSLQRRLDSLVVSLRPRHSGRGQMFNETAYGFVAADRIDPRLPKHTLVTRKPLKDLSWKEIEAIRDKGWREKIQEYLKPHNIGDISDTNKRDTALASLLARFSAETGHTVHSLRILVANQSVEPVPDAPYKGYAKGAYACCDIWDVPASPENRGRPKTQAGWVKKLWSYGDCRNGQPPAPVEGRPHPAARLVMRLFKQDVVVCTEGGQDVFYKVAGYADQGSKLDLRPLRQADSSQKFVAINILRKNNLRKVSVSPSGVVQMPSRWPS